MNSTQNKMESQVDATVLAALAAIQRVQRGSGYGSVEMTVHAGKITQIERREKERFAPHLPG